MNKSMRCALIIAGLGLPFSTVFAQDAAGWGLALEEAGKKIKIGGRIQGIIENDSETESQDFYLRRTRFNIAYKPWDGHTFVYDIRNDNANKADKGEGKFSIGDAFWKIDVDNGWVDYIKVFRSKVDISYSQTSSSKNLFNPDRAGVAEHASDFVVHNRRAANLQANGHFGDLAYQVVLSDGVDSGDLKSVTGDTEVEGVNHQKFTYGTKLRYFFQGSGKRNKVQDTFYGTYDTLSLGVGYFANDGINVALDDAREFSFRRSVTNVELSYAFKNFRFLGEYFSFTGDLVNLDATDKKDMLGDSNGYFTQAEYVFGKWAPYVGYEEFDKWSSEDEYVQKVTTLGINYYKNLEAERFGLTYKKTENDEGLGGKDSERLYAYMMLNF